MKTRYEGDNESVDESLHNSSLIVLKTANCNPKPNGFYTNNGASKSARSK
jgi:hypothetical protein